MRKILLLCIALILLISVTMAQVRVSGTVTDPSDGESLVGVNVVIKDTQIGTVTDIDGNYTLEVPSKDVVLVFSYLGFKSVEETVGNRSQINIQLQPDLTTLGEVVVTALNIEKNEKSLGYSVTQLSGDKINTVQTPSMINALSGKVAGVNVGNIANGVAGSKRIVIRGAASLTGNNQPLWVIDGIPINSSSLGGPDAYGGVDYGDGLTGINPDDIASISVLKGNAAAALYGSQASNGVILVTTKSGKGTNGKMNVDISSSLMADMLINTTDFQYQYGQSSRVQEGQPPVDKDDAYSSGSWGPPMTGQSAVFFDGATRPYLPVEDNYQRFFNTGTTFTNTAALSGSNENHDYRVSLSNLTNSDIIPNAKFNRTSLNTKLHSKYGKLTSDIVLIYNYEKANNRPFIGGNHSNLFYSLAYMPGNINSDWLKPGYNPDGTEFTYAESISNPYYVVNKVKQEDAKNRFIGSITLNYDLTNWLYTRGRLMRDYYYSARSKVLPEGNQFTSYPEGQLDQRSRESTVSNYELIIGVKPLDLGKLSFNGFVGGNRNERLRDEVSTSGYDFVVPGVHTFNNLATKQPQTSHSLQKTNSLFGNFEVSYDEFLFLTLTGRNDWFSTLPIKNNNLFYPSASLSFVFSDALNLPEAISFGKLRASTAQVSGDTDPYQLDLSYRLALRDYNGQPLQYIGTDLVPNRELKPLLSTDYEVGLEMDFLDNRIGFDVAYYNRRVVNDIVQTAVSKSTGFSDAILNVGKLNSKGFELLLRATPISTTNFSWRITSTFSKNDNKVVSLGAGVEGAPIVLATAKSGEAIIQLEEGHQYGGIYAFTYQRDDNGNKILGDNGNPLYNAEYTFVGNSVYDKLFGFTNTFSYKGFSLYFLLDGKFGASIYSETNAIAYSNGKHKATLVGREDGFIPEGVTETGEPNTVLIEGRNSPNGPGSSISSYYDQISDIAEEFIYDASFLKLREVSFRYNLPGSVLGKLGLNYASISLVARNLLTLYQNAENVDPESSVASGNAQGIERMVYPSTRNLGVTLKFGL
ncbi:MAG: SusC/RagA family TonB-linked outer membrane protein [Bacteroidota bacterium]